MRFNTSLIHGNIGPKEDKGATNVPIYQCNSFQYETARELEEVFSGKKPGFIYTRINNPTVEAFERRIAFLEEGIAAVATSSGMAAIALAILNLVRSGDEIVSASGIFGGTYSLFRSFENLGIKTRFAEDSSLESFEKHITDKTKVIFIETIGNPRLDVPNIRQIAELARKRGIALIVDSTVTTPYLVKPIKLGADVVVHSTSKFINGSGSCIGGIIVASTNMKIDYDKYPLLKEYKKYGEFAYIARLRNNLLKDFGACISPFNAFLNTIGLETLGVRMERICENALCLAKALKENKKVISVNYPGLEESIYHQLATEQFGGKYGAILTIRVGTKENAFKVIDSLRYAINSTNIGDVRTLVVHPASTIYTSFDVEEKEAMGVYEDMIRICVGLEDVEDIIEDFYQALEKV